MRTWFMCILIIHHLTYKSFLVSSPWPRCISFRSTWMSTSPQSRPQPKVISCLCKAQFHSSADTQPWPGQATTSCTAPTWIWSPTRGRLSAWYTSPSHWINIFVLILVFFCHFSFIFLFLFSFWNFITFMFSFLG